MRNQSADRPLLRSLYIYIVCILSAAFPGNAHLGAQISNPIPEKIQPAGITLTLHDLVKLPATSQTAPKARINLLREADDGSGRLFVNDLNGIFYVIRDGKWDLYLNLRGQFPKFISAPGKGTGFGAFAFHPDFAQNGIFYTTHAEQPATGVPDFTPDDFVEMSMQWVLYEWTAQDPAADRFEGTKREILRFDYPDELHGLQDLSFNSSVGPGDPDFGMLYLCVGEGGSSLNFLDGNLQQPNSYLGSIFRIDPRGKNSPNGQYGIPEDNPFFGQSERVQEIWVSGFRNPHRITWDAASDHKMLVGDIGEMNCEEVNILEKGKNYGWPYREGYWLYNRAIGREFVYPLPADDSIYHYSYPTAMFDHDEGSAIVGGYVCRATAIPELYGKYLFGDIVNGRVFIVEADSLQQGRWLMPMEILFEDTLGLPVDLQALEGNGRADLRFGNDLSGNIYLLTKADGVVRTMHAPTTSMTHPQSDTGALRITPNPATDRIRISTSGEPLQPGTTLGVYTIGGDLIKALTLDARAEVDISDLPPGYFLVAVFTGSVIRQTPLVIVK